MGKKEKVEQTIQNKVSDIFDKGCEVKFVR